MASNKLTLLGQYTVQESWETDVNGNAGRIWDNIVYPLLQAEDMTTIIVVFAANNSASNYKLVEMVGVATTLSNLNNVSTVVRQMSNETFSLRAINNNTIVRFHS